MEPWNKIKRILKRFLVSEVEKTFPALSRKKLDELVRKALLSDFIFNDICSFIEFQTKKEGEIELVKKINELPIGRKHSISFVYYGGHIEKFYFTEEKELEECGFCWSAYKKNWGWIFPMRNSQSVKIFKTLAGARKNAIRYLTGKIDIKEHK